MEYLNIQNQPNWLIIALVSASIAMLFNYIQRLAIRMIEGPKLKVGKQWITKKGAKDDEGKPFVFIVTGINIKNERPLWIFPRDTAEISQTRITVFDKDGNLSVGSSKSGRWWDYELSDSDPLFPKNYVIPQEENPWVYISPATEKKLILGYWILKTNNYYIATTSTHKKNRWLMRDEKIKGRFPFYIRVDIIGKSFVDTKRMMITCSENGDWEIKETVFPFKEKPSY